ncbi:MAG TPA: ABC transporter ATP-binding protein [Usitatibacter sp.]|nr:ABC transporter ATP-binding protein [Usitatibacter sp.]
MNPEATAVRLHDAAKTYRAGEVDVPALRGISIDIPYHRFSMIVGASGSGKSTLLNLVGCIDTPTRGSVEVCGTKVADLDDDQLSDFRARNIGFIFQTFSLVPVLSAYENVEYPLVLVGAPDAERKRKTSQVLEAVGLGAFADRRPNELSGGQRQRVAIARALVKAPQIVLADEPTANLDSETGASIIELMRKVQAESRTTFLFATHDQQLMSQADEIFVIRDGTLVDQRHGRAGA